MMGDYEHGPVIVLFSSTKSCTAAVAYADPSNRLPGTRIPLFVLVCRSVCKRTRYKSTEVWMWMHNTAGNKAPSAEIVLAIYTVLYNRLLFPQANLKLHVYVPKSTFLWPTRGLELWNAMYPLSLTFTTSNNTTNTTVCDMICRTKIHIALSNLLGSPEPTLHVCIPCTW